MLHPVPWSRRTALDPKHRPQQIGRPSTTVRREWARYPQEAHLLDRTQGRLRRLRACEIQRLQGFPPGWFDAPGVGALDAIRGAGDALPPPLAETLFRCLREAVGVETPTAVEVCAGSGGMALGAHQAGFRALALVERWAPAVSVLTHQKPWAARTVHEADVRAFDFSPYRGADVLCGGPPCQPWSNGGAHLGQADPRDLLTRMPNLVVAVRPKAFVFENVEGLLAARNEEYLQDLVARFTAPAPGLRYGVLCALFDAGRYGIPQHRRRSFIVGLADRPARDVGWVFDACESRARPAALGVRPIDDVLQYREDDHWYDWPFG